DSWRTRSSELSIVFVLLLRARPLLRACKVFRAPRKNRYSTWLGSFRQVVTLSSGLKCLLAGCGILFKQGLPAQKSAQVSQSSIVVIWNVADGLAVDRGNLGHALTLITNSFQCLALARREGADGVFENRRPFRHRESLPDAVQVVRQVGLG